MHTLEQPLPNHRWRTWSMLGLGIATVMLFGSMGLVGPAGAASIDESTLRPAILQDFYRLESAVTDYVADTGEFPTAVFDLTEGYDGGLADATFVPFASRERWQGPYLRPGLSRPTASSFWSLAEPQSLLDVDGDREPDEIWGRLNRGYGEIGDSTAAWLDISLDDGVADTGRVQVTSAWIWFQILEQ